jgi:hypothetical protein
MTPCLLQDICNISEETIDLIFYQKTETTCSSETSTNAYQVVIFQKTEILVVTNVSTSNLMKTKIKIL